jgi:hypothetical protein
LFAKKVEQEHPTQDYCGNHGGRDDQGKDEVQDSQGGQHDCN